MSDAVHNSSQITSEENYLILAGLRLGTKGLHKFRSLSRNKEACLIIIIEVFMSHMKVKTNSNNRSPFFTIVSHDFCFLIVKSVNPLRMGD